MVLDGTVGIYLRGIPPWYFPDAVRHGAYSRVVSPFPLWLKTRALRCMIFFLFIRVFLRFSPRRSDFRIFSLRSQTIFVPYLPRVAAFAPWSLFHGRGAGCGGETSSAGLLL